MAKRRKATSGQKRIAQEYKIPMEQAHTISIEKYKAYGKYKYTKYARLQRWLDKQDERRMYERGEICNG